jgi:hypothetical protein
MKTSDMERQVRMLDARSLRIEQILPTLVTRDDLKAELQLVVASLQHEMAGLATAENLRRVEAKTDGLTARTDRIEGKIATLATKQQLDSAVATLATKQELESAVAKLATKEELANLATREDVRALGKQIAALKPRRTRRG